MHSVAGLSASVESRLASRKRPSSTLWLIWNKLIPYRVGM